MTKLFSKSNFYLFKVIAVSLTVFSLKASAYLWPVAYMNEQHRVVGVLNECRGARDHFHDGIDITAYCSTKVYSVSSGLAYYSGSGENEGYRVEGTQTFWYIHLGRRFWQSGTYVAEGESLGKTNSLNHVHFGEGSDLQEINPLRNGAINPFTDNGYPGIHYIQFYKDESTSNQLDPINLPRSTDIDIIARVSDTINPYGGENNGIYKLGYGILQNNIYLYGPYFNYQFDNWLSSTCIRKVYFPGSNTGTYIYNVTNTPYLNGNFWTGLLIPGQNYTCRVIAQDIKGVDKEKTKDITIRVPTTGIEEKIVLSSKFDIISSTPSYMSNIFRIQLSKKTDIKIEIFDKKGRLITTLINGTKEPGTHKFVWHGLDDSGRKVPNGIYFFHFKAGDFEEVKKIVLIK